MQLSSNLAPVPMPAVSGSSSVTVTGTPSQENLVSTLEASQKSVETAIQYVDQMLIHLGVPQKEESNQPSTPGVMGRAFDLRSRTYLLTTKLESLASYL